MPAPVTERRLAAQVAAHTSWANTPDRTARTAPAREGLRARFAREIDPDGTLPPAVREQRVEAAWKAHFLRLALASAKARRGRRESTERQALAAQLLDEAAQLLDTGGAA